MHSLCKETNFSSRLLEKFIDFNVRYIIKETNFSSHLLEKFIDFNVRYTILESGCCNCSYVGESFAIGTYERCYSLDEPL